MSSYPSLGALVFELVGGGLFVFFHVSHSFWSVSRSPSCLFVGLHFRGVWRGPSCLHMVDAIDGVFENNPHAIVVLLLAKVSDLYILYILLIISTTTLRFCWEIVF